MVSNKITYQVEFTDECIEEINEIYEYISKKLIANESAKRLIQKVKKNILLLSSNPRLYTKIEKENDIELEYRRMVINNYVVLYTIDDEKKIVYISHMYYGKRNYLD